MKYQIKSTADAIEVIGQTYRLHFSLNDRKTTGLEIYHRDGEKELLMGKSRYFGKLVSTDAISSELPAPKSDSMEGKTFEMITSRAKVIQPSEGNSYIILDLISPNKAQATIQFILQNDGCSVDINAKLTVTNRYAEDLGFLLFCLDCQTQSERVRLMPALYSGWNEAGRSLMVYPRFSSNISRQFTLMKHYIRPNADSIEATHQGVVFSYPEGMLGAVVDLDPGTEIVGSWHLELGEEDVWNPDLLEKAEKYAPHDPGIQYPRYNYNQHLANWAVFMQRPELFIEFGEGFGFFHRGYHKVCRGRMLSCGAHPYKGFLRDTEAASRKSRLCELAWGGSANALLAYTLFIHGEDWAKEKALAVVKAVTDFKDGNYQVKEGPIKGAWWNGFLVDEDRFSDRFGSDNLYTPNGGISNYFLGKILLEGHCKEPRLIKMIENNCDYLKRIEFEDGGIPFGFKPNGKPALDRHSIEYKGDYAIPTAFGAISHLTAYQLTDKEEHKKNAERLLNHLIKHVEKNNWRYHGYDTYGTNSQSLGWNLAILSEFIIAGFKQAQAPAEKTFRALLSHQHTFDMGIERHSNLEQMWGGEMRNRGTFPTGSSRHFMQDYDTGHNRFDPALGLWVYYQATGDARAYTSLINFLNNLTYHQFTNPDLPIGFGAVCERISFVEGEFNDQVQTLHSNPLQHLLVNRNLFLMGAGVDVDQVQIGTEKLKFTLTGVAPVSTWFAVGGNGIENVRVTSDDQEIYIGPCGHIPCRVDGKTTFEVKAISG